MKRLVHFIFAWVWRGHLWDEWAQRPYRLHSVLGWNKCRYDTAGGHRVNCTFIPRWHPEYRLYR